MITYAVLGAICGPFISALLYGLRRAERTLHQTRGLPMRTVNKILKRLGVLLVPAPPSAKMLREHANTSEAHHPSRGGRTVAWMRTVADLIGPEARR